MKSIPYVDTSEPQTSFALPLINNSYLSLAECITHSPSMSLEHIKLIATVD